MQLELRLAYHASSSCRHGRQALEINRLGAIDAGAVTAVVQAGQRCTHVCELVVIALHLGILQRRALPLARLVFQIVHVRGSYACRGCCSDRGFPRRADLGQQFALPPQHPGSQRFQGIFIKYVHGYKDVLSPKKQVDLHQ
jgi:hypothetical protein